MGTSIVVCIAAYFALVLIIRRDAISFGLPIAYMSALLLIHVFGAYVHYIDQSLTSTAYVEIGIYYVAIGAVSFVVGTWAVRFVVRKERQILDNPNQFRFAVFCVFAGWFFTFGLGFLHSIPSLGAAIGRAGAVWMLGIVIGLRGAVRRKNLLQAAAWVGGLAVYPIVVLVSGGFLSYGSTAIIIVSSVLLVIARSRIKMAIAFAFCVYLSLSVFVNYYGHRDQIREKVWHDAPLADRIDVVWGAFSNFQLLDLTDYKQVLAIDQRLNQNFFVGLAATRLSLGDVEYLHGRSVWEGVLALVPRTLWPEKPVIAGSGTIVADMTGLRLSESTSFGVGNVMEFQINFGMPGVIGGFFILGFLIRWLDRNAASALRRGDFGNAIVFFVPAISLIQPNGSIVELCSGSAAGLVGALGWRWVWNQWFAESLNRRMSASRYNASITRYPQR
jgi:hypothetical protein